MYESPIKIIESTTDSLMKAIIKQRDDAIFAEIQSSFGVALDREELIRALQYDRDQYNKGYDDGKRDAIEELVRCKDCSKISPSVTPIKNAVWCREFRSYMPCDGFCSYGERKDNA